LFFSFTENIEFHVPVPSFNESHVVQTKLKQRAKEEQTGLPIAAPHYSGLRTLIIINYYANPPSLAGFFTRSLSESAKQNILRRAKAENKHPYSSYGNGAGIDINLWNYRIPDFTGMTVTFLFR
jgi:hypothetical protein